MCCSDVTWQRLHGQQKLTRSELSLPVTFVASNEREDDNLLNTQQNKIIAFHSQYYEQEGNASLLEADEIVKNNSNFVNYHERGEKIALWVNYYVFNSRKKLIAK